MKEKRLHQWPDDTDGDVFRRLSAKGFDFTKIYSLDFYVDFESWPPRQEAIEELKSRYADVRTYSEQCDDGYVLVRVNHQLTYTFVIETQRSLSKMCSMFGGACDSWGILHD